MNAEKTQKKEIRRTVKNLRSKQEEHQHRLSQTKRLERKLTKVRDRVQRLEKQISDRQVRLLAMRANAGGTAAVTTPAKALRHARVFINPGSATFAKQCGTPEALVELLRKYDIQAEAYLKTSKHFFRQQIREAVRAKEPLVIAVGGDGTIEAVALELLGSETTLGIIPAGWMNNLANGLGIPFEMEQACALLAANLTRLLDVGCLSMPGQDKPTYFLETAGLGLSIAWPAGQDIKKHRWSALPDALRKIFSAGGAATQIELDTGEKFETHSKLVTVSNAPYYGLKNLVAPEAKMDDGTLDLALYDGLGDINLAAYFVSTSDGKRDDKAGVKFYRAHTVKVRSSQPMPATADKSELPIEHEFTFEVLPHALNVIVGHGVALNWPVAAIPEVPPAGQNATGSNGHAAEPAKTANTAADNGQTEKEAAPQARAA